MAGSQNLGVFWTPQLGKMRVFPRLFPLSVDIESSWWAYTISALVVAASRVGILDQCVLIMFDPP